MAFIDLNDDLTINSLNIGVDQAQPKTWIPAKPITPLAPIVQKDRLNVVVKGAPVRRPPSANNPPGQTGTAPQVANVSVTQEPIKVQAKTMSLISVTFSVNPIDLKFGGVRVWFNGYQGGTVTKPHWLLMCDGAISPIYFIVESNGATVQCKVQAFDTDGNYANFNASPTVAITLNGVVNPPPAPTISQYLVGTPTGFQFAFDQVQLPAGTEDVIDSYRIYRNTTHTSSAATLIHTFKHDPTNNGDAIVFTDTINDASGTFYWYWVTSVDTKGLESTKSEANASDLGVIGSIGSIPVSLSTPFSATTTSSSVTWKTRPSMFFTRADGTKTTVGQTSTAITSLRAKAQYFFFPYWRESDQSLQWVAASDVSIPNITGVSFASGSSQWIQTASSTTISGAFSIEFWFKGNAAAKTALASLSSPQGTGVVTVPVVQILQTAAGEITFATYDGTSWESVTTSGANTDDGAWHHVVCTWDGSTSITVWVDANNTSDGVTFWSTAVSTVSNASAYWHFDFCGGATGAPCTSNTFGTNLLSNISLYASCLDVTQVGAHFQSYVNLGEIIYEEEIGYDSATHFWELDETSGTTATDAIGSNTGTYEASPTLNQTSPIVTVEGSPQIAWPFVTLTAVQQQNLRNRVPLSGTNMSATTTSSGSGSGSGGGSGGGYHGGGGGGNRGGCFTGNTLVKTDRGNIPIKDVKPGDHCLTAKMTWRPVAGRIEHPAEPREMQHMGDEEYVTFDHHVLACGHWVKAGYVFQSPKERNEPVFTLRMFTREPEALALSPRTEHSFTLANGVVVTNNTIIKN